MPKILLIIASTRPGRLGGPVADWALEGIARHGGFTVEVADLRELNLPHMDEPNHPLVHDYTKPHTFAWSATVDSADAFVVVTPEYNYAMAPAFLNALDYLYHEWNYKPVGFVSYGGISGGMRSTAVARQVVANLKMVAIPEQVNFVHVKKDIVDGRLKSNDFAETSLDRMLNELQRWHGALASMRQRSS